MSDDTKLGHQLFPTCVRSKELVPCQTAVMQGGDDCGRLCPTLCQRSPKSISGPRVPRAGTLTERGRIAPGLRRVHCITHRVTAPLGDPDFLGLACRLRTRDCATVQASASTRRNVRVALSIHPQESCLSTQTRLSTAVRDTTLRFSGECPRGRSDTDLVAASVPDASRVP
jgi:hypothetical protein